MQQGWSLQGPAVAEAVLGAALTRELLSVLLPYHAAAPCNVLWHCQGLGPAESCIAALGPLLHSAGHSLGADPVHAARLPGEGA